jgi:transposase
MFIEHKEEHHPVTGTSLSDRVVIAVDPHKASRTAAALDSSLQPLDAIRVPVSREGYRQLRRFARRWSDPGWRSKALLVWALR